MLAIAPLNLVSEVAGTTATLGAAALSTGAGMTSNITSTTMGFANLGQTIGSTIWKNVQDLLRFIKAQRTAIQSAMFNQANTYKNTALLAAMNTKNTIKQEAKDLYKQGVTLARLSKTLKFIFKILRKLWPIFKWVWILTKLMNNLGVWLVRTMEVIIYRIFHFKDCFLWYMLEIIGFILYVPFEFLIWLFCMKESEKSFWKLVDDIDCMFKDMTGFHIFHYSDNVLKKCYAVRIPPFPYQALPLEGDGEFTEAAFIRFIVEWFLPPSPQEVGQAVHTAVDLAKESGPVIAEAAGIVKDEIKQIFSMKPPNPADAVKVVA